ncbi:glutamate 5-kinase [Georgenia sp. Z1344]|uniref:glutamate 5-kinase n=1 Tax=Georgenia sp. Z1344 TaxID=3416706 RepID=UPI003CFB1174
MSFPTVHRPLANRALLARAGCVVVKIGSSSLTRTDGSLDLERIAQLSTLLATRVAQDRQVVLVSSGAIAAGLAPLGLSARPKDLATQQAAASVGQGMILARYTEAFARHGRRVGQVLLTADDLVRRQSHVNAARALDKLLSLGVTPIVNENDAVATDEIRFGDNDRLAALVANLVRADALVLLTDVDGLYDGHPAHPTSSLIPTVIGPEDLAGIEVTGRGSAVGTGGMVTKLEAASIATGSGIPVVLTDADHAADALAGRPVGTWFAARGRRMSARRLWLAHAARPRGSVLVDAGAAAAVGERQRSLLIPGITEVVGDFEAGDVVEVLGPEGLVARGVSGYDTRELTDLVAAPMAERANLRPAVHRDDLAVMRDVGGRAQST